DNRLSRYRRNTNNRRSKQHRPLQPPFGQTHRIPLELLMDGLSPPSPRPAGHREDKPSRDGRIGPSRRYIAARTEIWARYATSIDASSHIETTSSLIETSATPNLHAQVLFATVRVAR